jgi:hypothetical protein
MNSDDWPFEQAVREVMALLVRGDYREIERRTAGVRLSAVEMGEAVKDYGKRLVLSPDAVSNLNVVPITSSIPPSWSVYVPLWTAEEGRSDLTLELTIKQLETNQFQIEVDNLHVL